MEILGVSTALVYLYFSIKQKIWLWPFGILTSSFYIIVFFSSQLYADMGLQVYYLAISFYGWYFWLFGGSGSAGQKPRVTRIRPPQMGRLMLAAALIYIMLLAALKHIPGLLDIPASDLPYWDAFTTASSIVATWMLARKILEQWLVWIVVDAVSMGLYIYKGLFLTAGLFFVYTILAVIGYFEWKKDIKSDTGGSQGS
jgi:nicotinamide mononucleotide transporter